MAVVAAVIVVVAVVVLVVAGVVIVAIAVVTVPDVVAVVVIAAAVVSFKNKRGSQLVHNRLGSRVRRGVNSKVRPPDRASQDGNNEDR